MLLVINDTEPVSEKSLGWFVTRESGKHGDTLHLHEVVEVMYRHPDVPDHANIAVVEIKLRDSAGAISERAASWVVMKAIGIVVGHEQKSGVG